MTVLAKIDPSVLRLEESLRKLEDSHKYIRIEKLEDSHKYIGMDVPKATAVIVLSSELEGRLRCNVRRVISDKKS